MAPVDFATPPGTILIIKPSALGDIVHSLPFLDTVHRCLPDAAIHWVVARGLHTFLEGHPLIERLWVIDKDRWKEPGRWRQTAAEIIDLVRGLRRERFDLAVDLSGLLRSGLIAAASGAPCRLGFKESDEGSPLFYTHRIHGSMAIHAIDRYLALAEAMGCTVGAVRYPFAPYDPEPAILGELPSSYAVICPSAGKEANRWPAERFGRLAARLPLPTVVIGSRGDRSVCDEVVRHSEGRAVSTAGRTSLKELIPVIAKAAFFVTNDTGPMHIAAAVQVPVFAIFGPANPDRTGPYGTGHTVIREPLDCAPCYRWRPCDHWRCMEAISVDRVLREIERQGPWPKPSP